MVKLVKIQSPLFSNLYDSFLIDDDPLSTEQDWRNIFDYQFEKEEDYCGYALLEEDKVVGMMGMVFSTRTIEGNVRKFCNLHTWWVREDHRGRSLALLRPILKLNDYTITHFTPCDIVRAVTKRLGFADLSSQLRILLPLGISYSRNPREESSLTFDVQAIEEKLDSIDRKILTEHRLYDVGHLLVEEGDHSCYVLYTHVVRHRLPYCHIHYVSNMDVFAAKEKAIRSALIRRHRARFVAIEDRLVSQMKFRFSFKFWAPANALYKSTDVKPEQIDNLYADVVFLKLTVLPDISHEVKKFTERFRSAEKAEAR